MSNKIEPNVYYFNLNSNHWNLCVELWRNVFCRVLTRGFDCEFVSSLIRPRTRLEWRDWKWSLLGTMTYVFWTFIVDYVLIKNTEGSQSHLMQCEVLSENSVSCTESRIYKDLFCMDPKMVCDTSKILSKLYSLFRRKLQETIRPCY